MYNPLSFNGSTAFSNQTNLIRLLRVQLNISVFLNKEALWGFKKAIAADSAGGREKCTRRPAQAVRKNVKFLLNPAVTGLFTAKNVFQSARVVEAKTFSNQSVAKVDQAGAGYSPPLSFPRKAIHSTKGRV